MLARNGELFATLRTLRNLAVHRRLRLRDAHPTAYVHPSCRISPDTCIEEFVFIGPGSQVDPGVRIGRYSMLASHVAIVGDDHPWDRVGTPMQFSGRPDQSRTEIGPDVWLGYRCLVRRGVTVGRGAIVGAHSVVTRDVEPYSVVGGVPARQIGVRFSSADERRAHDEMLSGELVRASFAEPLTAPRDLTGRARK